MSDHLLAATEALVLHRLNTYPKAIIPGYLTWRLERDGLLAPTQGGMAVTDKGLEALANALSSPPRLNPDAEKALSAINRADRSGLVGRWPGPPDALDVARLFDLVLSSPPDATPTDIATWQLTGAGSRELERIRVARRAATRMSWTQARVVRAVATGHPKPVAADRSYTSCHNHGWLTWAAGNGPGTGPRRVVTPTGWRKLIGYHRREHTPLHLPVRALVPGHVVRLAHRGNTKGPVRVIRVAPVTTSGGRIGYVVIAGGQPGRPEPYPDQRPLPPDTTFEVVDYQP